MIHTAQCCRFVAADGCGVLGYGVLGVFAWCACCSVTAWCTLLLHGNPGSMVLLCRSTIPAAWELWRGSPAKVCWALVELCSSDLLARKPPAGFW